MFNKFFGFDRKTEEDETVEINVQETFFRFICCKINHRGEKLFVLSIFSFMIIGLITVVSSMETYHRLCRENKYDVLIGPNCNMNWIGTVNNQILLATVFYLMLTFANLFFVDNNKNNPWMVDLQWKLATGLMPNSLAGFVYYYVVVFRGSTNVDIFNFGVWFCAIIMYFITGLCGLYETRIRHFMWSTISLSLTLLGSFIPTFLGVNVFNFENYDAVDILLSTLLLLIINFCLHVFLWVAFKMKMEKHGWWGYSKVKVSFEMPPTEVELGV